MDHRLALLLARSNAQKAAKQATEAKAEAARLEQRIHDAALAAAMKATEAHSVTWLFESQECQSCGSTSGPRALGPFLTYGMGRARTLKAGTNELLPQRREVIRTPILRCFDCCSPEAFGFGRVDGSYSYVSTFPENAE